MTRTREAQSGDADQDEMVAYGQALFEATQGTYRIETPDFPGHVTNYLRSVEPLIEAAVAEKRARQARLEARDESGTQDQKV